MFFIIFVIFILLIAALGTVVYVYLRQEQDIFIPKDKYESAINDSESPKHPPRPYKNTLFIIVGLIIGVLGVKLFASGLSGFADKGGGYDNLLALNQVINAFLIGAGGCILVSLSVIAFLYKDQIIVPILVTIKTMFNKIYHL
jgi:hypothetical protein